MKINISICISDKDTEIKDKRMFENIKQDLSKRKNPLEEIVLLNNNWKDEWSNERWEDTSTESKGSM